ncbi:unnamed protein product [Meganyctiphanes norvegica]|uniref:Uncharacterized protein n=1 Tax=Meganyctiphanes norvegica TaxID=48144 RepID=A0AAV2R513_MEGNR
MIRALPSLINENMIIKVIETIHQGVSRTRRTIGLRTCLTVLLQPHVQRLDLSGLFFKMRLPGAINTAIRDVVSHKVYLTTNLSIFNMESKCSDEILKVLGKNCPNIVEVTVTISDLVTNEGLKALSLGCLKLEKLGIYKCWEVTDEGIYSVLKNSKKLKEMQCDQLGNVLLSKFRKTDTFFNLTRFEQTQSIFEPRIEDVSWIAKFCPDLKSVRIYVDDDNLILVSQMGKLEVLELESSSILGLGFENIISQLGANLQTLQISCDEVSQNNLMSMGRQCPQLTTLHITTATIEGDNRLINTGNLFPSLTTLHMQVWKESSISTECVDFFLLWCTKLESLFWKADIAILTDEYLKRLLNINPLVHAKRLVFASDKDVPLTIDSVHLLIETCPYLEAIGMLSWTFSEEEFFELRQYVKTNNYNLTLS